MKKNQLSEINEDTRSSDSNQNQSWILWGIIIAIIIGSFTGGWFPEFAINMRVLGSVFLNSLMMLVVPLVMLSLIVGITQMGQLKKISSIGGKTIVYYLATTGIAVLIGIFIVILIKPGAGISHGENHPDYSYRIGGEYNRTVYLDGKSWEKTNYSEDFVLKLTDQNIQGVIETQTDSAIVVKIWEESDIPEKVYLQTEDGSSIPFYRKDRQLISVEPKINSTGKGIAITYAAKEQLGDKQATIGSTMLELLTGNSDTGKQGLIPSNIFTAMVQMEILPLILFSLLLGAALATIGEKAVPVINMFSVLNDTIMKIVHWIMYIAPIGIFGLISSYIGRAGGFSKFIPELISLGKYFFAVLLGLFIHGFIILPLILKLLGKRNPVTYAKGVAAALLNAFSTASSTATLPLTLEGVVEENKVSENTASFVLPLGATINMDGTALYESIAAIFIAQVYGIHLDPGMLIVIFATATLAAIGAAGIPEAGLVTMVIVMKAVDLPIEGLGLLLSIDWLLDRFRTTINVWGDSVGSAVIDVVGKESRIKSQDTR